MRDEKELIAACWKLLHEGEFFEGEDVVDRPAVKQQIDEALDRLIG